MKPTKISFLWLHQYFHNHISEHHIERSPWLHSQSSLWLARYAEGLQLHLHPGRFKMTLFRDVKAHLILEGTMMGMLNAFKNNQSKRLFSELGSGSTTCGGVMVPATQHTRMRPEEVTASTGSSAVTYWAGRVGTPERQTGMPLSKGYQAYP